MTILETETIGDLVWKETMYVLRRWERETLM